MNITMRGTKRHQHYCTSAKRQMTHDYHAAAARQRQRRAAESAQQTTNRLAAHAARLWQRRTAESAQQTTDRLAAHATRLRQHRATESAQQTTDRLNGVFNWTGVCTLNTKCVTRCHRYILKTSDAPPTNVTFTE